ncbi:MAG: hypothetical protein MI919_35380, partial [Holophagales bacterium]|nr:hypothetical protein [Holophagales bacterium]
MLEPILDHFGRLTAPDYIQAGVGFLLLALGKRLFWLAVGGLGFAVSLHLSLLLLPAQPAETRLALGLVAGVLGIVLALAIQKLAVAVAGFALGALVVASALPWVWPEAGVWLIPAAGAGGIAGLM